MKLIKENEEGFGILYEKDAGYQIADITDIKSIVEGIENDGADSNRIFIKCILQKYGVKNKNGRIYPKEILMREVERYQSLINDNSSGGEADHPPTSTISLHNISHIVRKIWWGDSPEDEHILYGILELVTTPGYHKYGIVSMVGDKILEYRKRGYRIGISSRGIGSVKKFRGENIVQPDFELVGWDLVTVPSTPGAWLYAGNDGEGKEVVKSNIQEIKSNNNEILNIFLG